MYLLPKFVAANQDDVFAFMHAHPFVVLTANGENGIPVATQVPVLLEKKEGQVFIECHVMRDTSHANALIKNLQALCLFSGPNTYISASWYTKKEVASTWNYQAVQAFGRLRILDEEALLNHLKRLTEKYEAGNSGEALVQNMDPGYVHKMMKAIVGFEMKVDTLEHVYKLSQNRTEKDFDTICQKLKDIGGDAEEVAKEMKRIKIHAYPQQKNNDRV